MVVYTNYWTGEATAGWEGYFAAPVALDTSVTRNGRSTLRVTTDSSVNTQGLIYRPQPTISAAVGTNVVAAFDVLVPNGMKLYVGAREDGAYEGYTENIVGDGTWKSFTVPYTTITTSASNPLGFQGVLTTATDGVVPVGTQVWFSQPLIERGTAVSGPYYDGDTPETTQFIYQWTATVRGSTTTKSTPSGISLVGTSTSTTDTIAIPAHQANDVIIIFGFNSTAATVPTLPSGWTNAASGTGTSAGSILAYRTATGSGTTSGSWTNANRLVCHVYRGSYSTPLVGGIAQNGGSGLALAIPGLTSQASQPFAAVYFGAHRTASSIPANSFRRSYTGAGAPVAAGYDRNPSTSFTGASIIVTAGSAWRTASIELYQALPPAKAGTAGGTWTSAGAAVGKKTVSASGAGTWSTVGAAVGKKIVRGAGSGAWSTVGAAVGKRIRKGVGTGTWSTVGAAAGQGRGLIFSSGNWRMAGAAVGKVFRRATGNGSWSTVGLAKGSTPALPTYLPVSATLTPHLGESVLLVNPPGDAILLESSTVVGDATLATS